MNMDVITATGASIRTNPPTLNMFVEDRSNPLADDDDALDEWTASRPRRRVVAASGAGHCPTWSSQLHTLRETSKRVPAGHVMAAPAMPASQVTKPEQVGVG